MKAMMMSVLLCGRSLVVGQAWTPGRSTYYTGINGGNCGFGTISTSSFPYGYIAAPNTAFYSGGSKCGTCFEVECVGPWAGAQCAFACSGKSVIIEVTDQCPAGGNAQWCSGDIVHFDLSQPAFDLITNNSACGVISTRYRQVPCPVQGNVIIYQKDGVNNYWMAIFVMNVGGAGGLTKVEMKDSATSAVWSSLTYDSGGNNFWVLAKSSGLTFPVSVRITASDGQVLTMDNVLTTLQPSTAFTSTQQFKVVTNGPTTGAGNSPVQDSGAPSSSPSTILIGSLALLWAALLGLVA